ncbi:MAG: (2Fe-2S)-binding protein [Gammaproteobacteria bacterium]|nr:(2Fe-2S)-binding protein [Gammaproteobacteria bacterium]MCB1922469.1 (2Fe-2S)-binding protein [Gammaproteobacteria bacterium]
MSETEKRVNLTINGKPITAPASLSVIQALWHAGYPRVKSIGCLQGVCGSCRVMVRRADSHEVTMELGCQLLVAEGMHVSFLVFPNPTHHTYELTGISNSWEVQARFHQIFPEADHCRHCGGCDVSCPKGIEVERGVELAAKGRFSEAGDLFIECVMCDLCMTACPENISPNHVGLFARRVTAYFHIRPSNLINRLETLRKGDLQVEI